MEIIVMKGGSGTSPKLILCPITGEKQLLAYLDKYFGLEPEKKKWAQEDFSLDSEEALALYSSGKKIVLQGIKSPAGYANYKHAFQLYSARNKGKLPEVIGLDLEYAGNDEQSAAAIGNGIGIGTYQLGLYKTTNGNQKDAPIKIILIKGNEKAEEKLKFGLRLAETQRQILDIVNAPSNKKTPESIADWAKKSAEKYGYKALVFGDDEITRVGMEALLAVNRGSEHKAKFLVLEYEPPQPSTVTIGLVGKGVTFDTGGLSIKPSRNMHYMKSDLGGAAAVLGTIEMAAREQVPAQILGFVPLTDNSVDATSTKPGDVIGSYSGKTIEVIDTDAEGRLILADALAYAVKNYSIDYLIDLATLTGSVVRTFGTHCAGLFTENDELANAMGEASKECGERVWRLPLWEEYGDEMKSDIADIRNLSITPMAGAITAAKFLEFFTEKHPAWAHLDIAGTAFHGNSLSKQYSATAYGIALLYHLIPQLTNAKHATANK